MYKILKTIFTVKLAFFDAKFFVLFMEVGLSGKVYSVQIFVFRTEGFLSKTNGSALHSPIPLHSTESNDSGAPNELYLEISVPSSFPFGWEISQL